ncbi:hypothetical protein GCM10022226_20110 [Sphaerisporangium flaviroseum]|uniref:DUF2742 domain-containing protein n=1 Tax=Sphaerisporangium flaviroseum TaxID=509199 RepID=A0ABP7HRX3_9ACTN
MIRVRPRCWDPAERAAARQLDQMEPAWAVWYGLGARRFYAAAVWAACEPLMVQAGTADELRDRMREAEVGDLMREAERRDLVLQAERSAWARRPRPPTALVPREALPARPGLAPRVPLPARPVPMTPSYGRPCSYRDKVDRSGGRRSALGLDQGSL